jgi:hypothetical protein
MGSLPEMGGPMIGKEYCLPSSARYKIKHSGEKVALVNKWDICDENKVVVFQAIKEKSNANAPNSSWSFKYETRVQDVEGKLVTRFKFKVHYISKKTHKERRNSILKFIFSN